MKTLESLDFDPLVRAAVRDGLEAAAVLDVDCKVLAVGGAIDDDETRALVAIVTSYLRWPEMLTRMLEGELIESQLDKRFSGSQPPPVGSGGSGSGPAELPLVEWGLTVRRKPS